jgi:hypothetical protein
MIIGESNVHDGASFNLVSDTDWAVFNGVHTKNSALGRIDNGSSHHGAKDATVGDCESATSHILKTNLVITSLD